MWQDYLALPSAPIQLVSIPRTIYNVWEGATKKISFDVTGMEPRMVLLEQCPPTFRVLQMCYVVYMERPAHMEFLRAYIPEAGGLDIEYYSQTAVLMDNALGHPLIRYGSGNNNNNPLVYTLTGSCFQIESNIITADGKMPPVITLGNACKRAPRLGMKCATPLNNPFITDAMTTPILLPDGLSATHTHLELSQIFGSSCADLTTSSQNSSVQVLVPAGPMLYQSILRSSYANTTPVDFVELPGILDVVYITPTSVGLISTKRILFRDRTQPGYVRATNLIYCPPNYFGQVGSVCHPCSDSASPGHSVSVAWQIQCGGGTFETFTVVSSKDVTGDDVQKGLCIYASSKSGQCPTGVTMAPQQPFNMAADALDSAEALTSANTTNKQAAFSLVRCLISDAETKTGRSLFRKNVAEYNARIISPGQNIMSAASNPGVLLAAESFNTSDAADTARQCKSTIARGIGSFLPCSMAVMTPTPAGRRRRRLLQTSGGGTAQPLSVVEHHSVSLASSNAVSWNLQSGPSSANNNNGTRKLSAGSGADNGGGSSSNSDSMLPVWLLVIIIAVCSSLILLAITCFICRQRRKLRRTEREGEEETAPLIMSQRGAYFGHPSSLSAPWMGAVRMRNNTRTMI